MEALYGPWEFSAFFSVLFLIGFYFVLPQFVGRALLPLLQAFRPFGLGMGYLFGIIALVKYARERMLETEQLGQHSTVEPGLTPGWDKLKDHFLTPAKPTAWSLDVLQSIEWKRFEELVAAYFRQLGFDCRTLSCGPDGGVDATLYQDGRKIAIVQCKAWNTRPIGVKPVRELLGVMTHQQVSKGYFMATGGYTAEAIEFASTLPITLVTGEGMMNAIGRMTPEAQAKLLAIATECDYATPTCPSCGIKLVLRHGGRGTFWGCTNYPRCKVRIGVRGETD